MIYLDRSIMIPWMATRGRKWAATVDRRLSFARINRLLRDQPPTRIVPQDRSKRIYLFRSGFDRDLFVETFHKRFGAQAYVPYQ